VLDPPYAFRRNYPPLLLAPAASPPVRFLNFGTPDTPRFFGTQIFGTVSIGVEVAPYSEGRKWDDFSED
jgi:hypothetical protein